MGHRGVSGIPDVRSPYSAGLYFRQLRYEQESVSHDDSTLGPKTLLPFVVFHLNRVRETMIGTIAGLLHHS